MPDDQSRWRPPQFEGKQLAAQIVVFLVLVTLISTAIVSLWGNRWLGMAPPVATVFVYFGLWVGYRWRRARSRDKDAR